MHVEQVLGDVAPQDRCKCRENRADKDAAGSGGGESLWKRLFS